MSSMDSVMEQNSKRLIDLLASSQCENCNLFAELLNALAWNGEERQLLNALAGRADLMDRTDILNTLKSLGYTWKTILPEKESDESLRLLRYPLLVESRANKNLRIAANIDELKLFAQSHSDNLAYSFRLDKDSRKGKSLERGGKWLQTELLRFRPLAIKLYLISLFINAAGLVPPLYIKAVYNNNIPAKEVFETFALLPLVLAAVAIQIILSYKRQRELARAGAQLDIIINSRVIERTMRLKLNQLEALSPTSLTRRLRGYIGIRQLITGPVAGCALDLPYTIFYLAALAMISVPLAALALVMIVLSMGGVALVISAGNNIQRLAKTTRSGYENILVEAIENLQEIRDLGQEREWSARLEGASAIAVQQSLGSIRVQELSTVLTSEFSQLTGALILALGAFLALQQGTTVELGTLLAAMFFVWRIFRPFQMLFQAISRWEIVGPTITQLNRFMASDDGEPDSALTEKWVNASPKGDIELRDVFLKLNDFEEAALNSVSISIRKGSLTAIVGNDGAGKSSLLKVIQGQYKPSSGKIFYDGKDSRQFSLLQIRSSIAYLSGLPEVFRGSLRQNLLLGNPLSSDIQMEATLKKLGLQKLLDKGGLDQMMSAGENSSLDASDLYRIGLARVLLSKASVVLLNKPFKAAGRDFEEVLLQSLTRLRQSRTIIIITDNPNCLARCDQLIVMSSGKVAFQGKPADLLSATSTANP